jgi:beta-ketoacyl-acyl-carrier-protein synthase II
MDFRTENEHSPDAKKLLFAGQPHSHPRVVITGMGAVSPLGLNVPDLWAGLLAGRSGVRPITHFDVSGLPCRIGSYVVGFEPTRYLPAKEARRMARVSQYAIAAAQEALADAGLNLEAEDRERMGVMIGTGIGGVERFDEGLTALRTKGISRVSPFAVIAGLPNMPAHHVSVMTGAQGPISCCVTACASGTQAVGEGVEFIRRGAADVVVCGGVEAALAFEGPLAGFCAMRAVSLRNDEPERASRPFDAERDGFILGEGAGILIIERLEHALARAARIHAEILGHASSADSYHVAAPAPEGNGAARAMRWALQDAGVTPEQVDYINAHGTGTPANDATETAAIKSLFGERAYYVPISSSKSMLGHTMGAAGAIEAIVSVLTIRDGIIHPTINLENPDPQCDLDYVPWEPRRANVRTVLSNSFGLGGQNACLVIGRFEQVQS